MKKYQKKPIRISVIMPVYNADRYIEAAIKSILNQTFSYFEFIIINDASTDKSLAIINSYAQKDSRIKLLNLKKNSGIATALNTGLELAQGEYIARMDADDISLPERFQKQLYFMDNNKDCDISGTWLETFEEGSKKRNIWQAPLSYDDIKAEMIFNSALFHPTVIMRRKTIFDKYLYNSDFVPAEDYELWSRMSSKINLANIPEVLLHYRLHNKSITRTASNKQVIQANRVRTKILKEFDILPTVDQLKIHHAICSWDKVYLLQEREFVEDWLKLLLIQNSIINYTSGCALELKIEDINFTLNKFDSSYLVATMRKYIPVFRLLNEVKTLSFIQRVASFLPKNIIRKLL